MVEFHEIEFKYDASGISLKDFESVVTKLGTANYQNPSGWDYYFTNNRRVARFRAGNLNEITIKKQTNSRNNFVRQEVNLSIVAAESPKKTLRKVTEFLMLQGYEHSFSIHKNSSIYFFDKFDIVYYVVKDSSMREIGRFIEIEMDEHHQWKTIEEAYEQLLEIETKLKRLGLKHLERQSKSLFQMFQKSLDSKLNSNLRSK